MSDIETRFIPAVELRVSGDENKPTISGYSALFGSRSADLGGFVEVIRPGAFRRSIEAGADVLGRYNHDLMLGRTSNGTVRVSEDDKGLRYEIDPPNTAAARHPMELIRRGDVKGSSFAFRTVKDEWRKENGVNVRELVDVQLIDVGPVDQPAYPETASAGTVSVRALDMARQLNEQQEQQQQQQPDPQPETPPAETVVDMLRVERQQRLAEAQM